MTPVLAATKMPNVPEFPAIECSETTVTINGIVYTPEEIDVLLEQAIKVESESNPNERFAPAIAAGTYIKRLPMILNQINKLKKALKKDIDPSKSIAVERNNHFYIAYPFVSPPFYKD